MNTEHICVGCIWEDDCRAANLDGTECHDFWDGYDEFTYQLLYYLADLAERANVYAAITYGGNYAD